VRPLLYAIGYLMEEDWNSSLWGDARVRKRKKGYVPANSRDRQLCDILMFGNTGRSGDIGANANTNTSAHRRLRGGTISGNHNANTDSNTSTKALDDGIRVLVSGNANSVQRNFFENKTSAKFSEPVIPQDKLWWLQPKPYAGRSLGISVSKDFPTSHGYFQDDPGPCACQFGDVYANCDNLGEICLCNHRLSIIYTN
jgi:hypothetical protein